MNEKDLPVGIELVETNDMYGLPCIELVISCATKEIALDYYEKSEFALRLQELVKRDITNLSKLDKIAIETFGKKLWKHDIRKLQSLVEESQKTKKEEGKVK